MLTANTALIEKICVWRVEEESKRGEDVWQSSNKHHKHPEKNSPTLHQAQGYYIERTQ